MAATTRIWLHGVLGDVREVTDVVDAVPGDALLLGRVGMLGGGVHHGMPTVPIADTRHGLLVFPTHQVTWRIDGDRGVVTVIADEQIEGLPAEDVEVEIGEDVEISMYAADAAPGPSSLRYRELRRANDGEPIGLRLFLPGDDASDGASTWT